jgi:hypothetical protein
MSKLLEDMRELEQALLLDQALNEKLKKLGISEEEFREFKKEPNKWLNEVVAELFVEKIPKDFSKNKNGHYVVTLAGRNLAGAEEIAKLESAGFKIGSYARQVLLSNDYNKNHRLEEGKKYQVVLVHGKEVGGRRTTADLKAYAKKFGYEVPKAGIVPRIREAISDEKMKEMDFWYIAGLHDLIKDSGGDPSVLSSYRCDGESWLGARYDVPECEWDDVGAFVFLVPQVL